MRLTLRTMLAYMDDILEPADRDEIARKIAESQFATQLMQRLQECLRKTNLEAPKLSGKGVGVDPNTVAEYLDNTLAGERVPDFERVCLESDSQLAEVAACHQILTMVLGQPAAVDPAMKRRMYEAVLRAEHQLETDADGEGSLGDEVQIVSSVVHTKREVPGYLRESRGRKWRSIAAAVLLVVIFLGAVTMSLGPLDQTHPIARLFGSVEPAAENPPEQVGGDKAPALVVRDTERPASETQGAAPTAGGSDQPSIVVRVPESDAPTEAGTPPSEPTEAATTPTEPQTSPAPDVAEATAPSEPGQPPAASSTDTAVAPSTPDTATATAVEPKGTDAASTTESPTVDAPITPVPADAAAAVAPIDPTAPPPPEAAASPAPAALGRFLHDKGVILLKQDPQSHQWPPLAPGAPLVSGDRLLVLPTFRPTITLSAGITLQVAPNTMIELGPPDQAGVPSIKVLFGRVVASTTGRADAEMRIDMGPVQGTITFVDADATLGIEVTPYHAPGTDPEANEPQVAATLYAASGQTQWTAAGGASHSLEAPQRLVLTANAAEAPADPPGAPQIPKWVGGDPISPTDARAAAELVAALESQKPLLQALREMAEHRRVENRWLAAQCLALLDQFEPLLTAFNDQDQRPMWPVQLAAVRAALARGPATAAKVREACRPEQGAALYRMFWGYSKADLAGDQAAKLVGYLEHPNLDFRVLAFLNLQEATGKTYSYKPEAKAIAREQPTRRWKEDLDKGQILPRDRAALR